MKSGILSSNIIISRLNSNYRYITIYKRGLGLALSSQKRKIHSMPLPRTYKEETIIPHAVDKVFNVVFDVAKYPEFVPWCVRTTEDKDKLLTDADREFIEAGQFAGENTVRYVDMAAGFQKLNDSYVSRVLSAKNKSVRAEAIDARLFKRLVSEWRFSSIDEGCLVEFSIEFEFRSYLYAYVANLFFQEVATKMVSAFRDRCNYLYQNELK